MTATTGSTETSTATPSGQCMATMIETTTTIWIVFMISMRMPKDMNRRSRPRSLMILDSSCPDSHRLWNPSCRACSVSNRSSRMLASKAEVARVSIQRRTRLIAASTAPAARISSAYSATPQPSRSAMGPSTMLPSSSGIRTAMATPSGAMARASANCRRNGRR